MTELLLAVAADVLVWLLAALALKAARRLTNSPAPHNSWLIGRGSPSLT